MNYIKTALFCLLVMFANLAHTQNLYQVVRGQVVESITKIPIEGAIVQFRISDEKRGTAADKEGFFKFEDVPPGRYDFLVSMIGYNPVSVSNVVVTTGKETIN